MANLNVITPISTYDTHEYNPNSNSNKPNPKTNMNNKKGSYMPQYCYHPRPFSIEKIAKAIHAEHLLKSCVPKYKDLLIKRKAIKANVIKPNKSNQKQQNSQIIQYEFSPIRQRLHYNNLNDHVAILELPQIGFHYPFSFKPSLFKRKCPTRNHYMTKPIATRDEGDVLIESELMSDIKHFTKKITLGSYCNNLNNISIEFHQQLKQKDGIVKKKGRLNKAASNDNIHIVNDKSMHKSISSCKNITPGPLLFLTTPVPIKHSQSDSKKIAIEPQSNQDIISRNNKVSINCLQSTSNIPIPKSNLSLSNLTKQSHKSLILFKDDQTYNRIHNLDKLISDILHKS